MIFGHKKKRDKSLTLRTVEVAWQPRTAGQWAVLTSTRIEAARLWNDMVVRHARIRRLGFHLNGRHKLNWPSMKRWMLWIKGRYPLMSVQSAQQAVREFLDVVRVTRLRRKNEIRSVGVAMSKYPWRTSKYRNVIYTNQGALVHGSLLVLGNGRGSVPLLLRLPRELPGRLMEVTVAFDAVRVVCEIASDSTGPTTAVGVDLGVNTLIAAGDGERAVLISGREAKATVQWRAKNLASIDSAQSTKTKGSRRWLKLQRRKRKMLAKSANRIKDINHKATHTVVKAFPGAVAIVGKPFNDAAQKLPRRQAQQVSQSCNAKIIAQLAYKMNGARQVDEHYTSQTCPVCGERRRCRRVYRCGDCGFEVPRDVVGLTNIRSIGIHGSMVLAAEVPKQIVFVRPLRKYPVATRVVPGVPRQVVREAV